MPTLYYFWAQMNTRVFCFLLLSVICTGAGCANITSPTGGKKDITPPRLVRVSPADSLLNTRVKRIDLDFDEYITVNDVIKEVTLSPIISITPTVNSNNKRVTVKIVDSLLEDNTTYRLSFGTAIRDLHESNPFAKYTYTFSTGTYFDSLQFRGNVLNAATGLPDTGNMVVVLYSASVSDSAVVRQKPKYVTHTDGQGQFVFKGLPGRHFRLYAIKDLNSNLIYDGPIPGELIAFHEEVITPGDSSLAPVTLRVFAEIADTAAKKDTTAVFAKKTLRDKGTRKNAEVPPIYSVNIDSSAVGRKTYDINKPIALAFAAPLTLNKDKISLSYDKDGRDIPVPLQITADTAHAHLYHLAPAEWLENTVYTLRLAKGFAKDTAGADLMPSKYTFRTFDEEDYGKIQVHLPAKYYSPAIKNAGFLLMVTADNDTVYQKPVTDTMVNLKRLKPAKYTFRIIVDKNKNGKWDTGDLFAKLQPEEVIPYNTTLALKPGWENVIDFEPKPEEKKSGLKSKADK